MTNYDDLPLFPLHVVLFPDMPLPLQIFEPRYREMILRCREERSAFGIVLIQSGTESGEEAVSHKVGTTARIAQQEELPDGRSNILVFGETRFCVVQTRHDKPYLSAQVEPFWEEDSDPQSLRASFESVAGLFKTYLKSMFALTGRSLSALQLPQDPESLSYAVASVLQVSHGEKQSLLEMTQTERRLARESEILRAEIEAQDSLHSLLGERPDEDSLILPVDTQELSKLASLN